MKSCKRCGEITTPELDSCQLCEYDEFFNMAEPYSNEFLGEGHLPAGDCTICAHNKSVIERLKLRVHYMESPFSKYGMDRYEYLKQFYSTLKDSKSDKENEDIIPSEHHTNTVLERVVVDQIIDRIKSLEENTVCISYAVSKLITRISNPKSFNDEQQLYVLRELEQLIKSHGSAVPIPATREKIHPICPSCQELMSPHIEDRERPIEYTCPRCKRVEILCDTCGHAIKLYAKDQLVIRECKCGTTP